MQYRSPKEIMSNAMDGDGDLYMMFDTKKDAMAYRMRCYSTRRRESEMLQRQAVRDGIPPMDTGWEDLVFLITPEGLEWKLWIGIPTMEMFGCTEIGRGKGYDER